jgi:hypothetical protein
MKNTYKYITLHGNALPPMASGHYHEIRKMTHFSEYSRNRIKNIQYPDGEILFSFPLHPTTTACTAFST